MYKEYINVECSEKIIPINDFAKLQHINDSLPATYLDDDYDYYYLVLKNMYAQYTTPVINNAENYKYESPLLLFPLSCCLHLQCAIATASISISLYNEDQYLLYEILLFGHELVDDWTAEGTQILFNLTECIKNSENNYPLNFSYFSFTLKNGFTFTKEIMLEYSSKPLSKSLVRK